ncbi:hypothetical protein SAMN05421749_10174 [Acinetobacter marinus]|uniref:DUF2059 domain-containing protein n=1 Tax=Acinetobacter marinus TaxID=281375 RepID=A0A1G6GM37_9GAMM|nr:DUF2059 domain-containing protein [Acinetobacter marinus]SDB82236.1 hypothetical protein SAMN05421749_10174 [Acinetobacter marinus]
MKKLMISAALSLSMLTPMYVMAAPATDASVKELLKVTNSEQMMDQMNAQMESVFSQSIQSAQAQQGEPLNPEQIKVVDKYSKKLTTTMSKALKWSDLEPELIKIYQGSFDQADINALIEFYKTPLGKKTIEKMPIIMQQSMTVGQNAMFKIMPELTESMKGFDTELRQAATKSKGKLVAE